MYQYIISCMYVHQINLLAKSISILGLLNSILATRISMSAIVISILATRISMSAIVISILATRISMLAIVISILATRISILATRISILAIHINILAIHNDILAIHIDQSLYLLQSTYITLAHDKYKTDVIYSLWLTNHYIYFNLHTLHWPMINTKQTLYTACG